jgi:recombination protein RecT
VTLADTRNAVAQRAQNAGQPAQQQAPSLIQQIEILRPQMARVLPAHIDPDQMARAVITQLRKTPKLMTCTTESVLGAVMTCAQLGMMPGPGGEVWLIPRKGKAEFQLGYQGMVTLFWRHPAASGLTTATVYEGDDFEHEEGLEPKLRHKPSAQANPGNPIAYYAIARTVSGGVVWKVLYPWQVEKHRRRSSSPDSPAWVQDYSSMAEKTCIRVLYKVLPKNADTQRALANDGTVRTDLAPEAIDTPDWIPGELAAGPDDEWQSDGAE